MTITGARWANPSNTAAVVQTEDNGAVLVTPERVALWNEMQDWIGAGNLPSQMPSAPFAAPFAARLAARRYQAETGGATWNGWRVHTDRDARANLHAEYTAASDGTRADGEYWKFADGIFRALTNAQIMEMTLAVREHVKACFAVEAQKLAAHAAGEPVDIEAGWPNDGHR